MCIYVFLKPTTSSFSLGQSKKTYCLGNSLYLYQGYEGADENCQHFYLSKIYKYY